MNPRFTRLISLVIVLALIFGAVSVLVKIYPNILWFDMVGYDGVFWKILKTKVFLGLLVGVVFLIVTLINLYLLYRFTPSRLLPSLVKAIPIAGELGFDLRKIIYVVLAILAIGFSTLMGYAATEKWEHFLRYFNAKGLEFRSATRIITDENIDSDQIPISTVDLNAKGLKEGDTVAIEAGNQSETAQVRSIGVDTIQLDKVIKLEQGQKAYLIAATRDPIPSFNKSVNYYVFKMPMERYVCGSLFALFLLITLSTAVIYFFHGSLINENNRFEPSRRVKAHMFALIGITLLFRAWNYRFAMYDLLYTTSDVVRGGGGYAAIRARLPFLQILWGLAIICALIFLLGIFLRKISIKVAVGGFAVFFLVGLVGQIYPVFVQKWRVEPNKQALEAEYINYNIKATLHAYDLEDNTVTEEEYPMEGELSYAEVTKQDNASVINSVRLWDWRPLRRTFRQLQELRSQYDFADVDIDRYTMEDGESRQVMLSARELNIDDLPLDVRNDWFKRTYVYTHGYGAVMSPVNEILNGKPKMYIRDIDPIVYEDEWPNSYRFNDNPGPRIYYGERTNHYVITHPDRSEGLEFDYPETFGQDFAKYSYQGKGGVQLSSFWRKLVYMMKFNNELKFVLPGEISSKSRVLYHRNIKERVTKIAPFLRYDRDPYIVINDGRLIWMIDAYTVTDRYPYSVRMEDALRSEIASRRGRRAANRIIGGEKPWEKNYIRNSVKVTVDPYDGSIDFYIMEQENDPIVECYNRMFPGLFKPFDAMSENLKKHIRYPTTMFLIQARVYLDYHMKDPITFYASEDQWEIGKELYDSTDRTPQQAAPVPTSPFAPRQPSPSLSPITSEQDVQPYYVIIRQPGEEKAEFMLMLPFTPKNKSNLTAWMAARCDLPQYGQLLVYRFPKGKLAPGPMQVENFISQEPEMSQQISLWDAPGRGSRVLRGNLLIIPINNSLLYVEPIYIQAEDEESAIPELRKVVIGYGEKVVWGDSFDEALRKMFPAVESAVTASLTTEQGSDEGVATASKTLASDETSIADLVRQATRYFEQAETAQRAGKWSEYGQYQERLQQTLKQLEANAK